MAKTRVSNHHGRMGNPKHNDREFDVFLTDHIDEKRTKENLYWTIYDTEEKRCGFDDAESLLYAEKFGETLEQQNERYRANGQYKRIKTLDDWRKSKKYGVEESILQIGDKKFEIADELFVSIVQDYLAWEMDWSEEHGNPFTVIDIGFHFDETSPHAHKRRTWHYQDENGLWHVGQDKALELAEIGLPDPTKPRGRFNNRKMTFDKMCREKWIEICESYGIDVEKEPIPDKSHKGKRDFIYEQEKQISEKQVEIAETKERLSEKEKGLDKDIQSVQEMKLGMICELQIRGGILEAQQDMLRGYMSSLNAERYIRQSLFDEQEKRLNNRQRQLDDRERKNSELIMMGRRVKSANAFSAIQQTQTQRGRDLPVGGQLG